MIVSKGFRVQSIRPPLQVARRERHGKGLLLPLMMANSALQALRIRRGSGSREEKGSARKGFWQTSWPGPVGNTNNNNPTDLQQFHGSHPENISCLPQPLLLPSSFSNSALPHATSSIANHLFPLVRTSLRRHDGGRPVETRVFEPTHRRHAEPEHHDSHGAHETAASNLSWNAGRSTSRSPAANADQTVSH